MKITFFIALFSISGVPLAQVRLARALQRRGNDVEVVFGYCPPELRLPVIENVSVSNLNISRVGLMLPTLVRHISRRKADVIFSAEDHMNSMVLLAAIMCRSKSKISVSSRVNPFDTYSSKKLTKRWVLKHLVRLVQNRADAWTCVSKDMVAQYAQIFGPSKRAYAYNLIVDEPFKLRMLEPLDQEHADWWQGKIKIVAVGRLATEKGFADLLHAIKLSPSCGEIRLTIVGEGPQRNTLEKIIIENEMSASVRLVGNKPNPLKYFYNSDISVLASYVEGLPNVLVEGIACGCTPVATDCPTGPREVLQGGSIGYLVEVGNVASISKGIDAAIRKRTPLEQLSQAVMPFTEEHVIARQFSLLGIA